MYLELKKLTLTNERRTPFALSNLGNVNILEELIGNCLADNPKMDKLPLGKLIADTLMKSRKFYAKSITVNPGQTKLQPKRIVLDIVDPFGNVENLWIFLSQEPTSKQVEVLEVPECKITDFYLGSDCGSGIKATSLKDFLEYIIAEVRQAEDDGATHFDMNFVADGE